jgi:uncharacterized protein (TIGR02452 family)
LLAFSSKFSIQFSKSKNDQGIIEVVAEDVISCSYRLAVNEQRSDCVILNFANGVHPGGAWTTYGKAQEECILKASGVYASIITQHEFYQANSQDEIISSDFIIYSPDFHFSEILNTSFLIILL